MTELTRDALDAVVDAFNGKYDGEAEVAVEAHEGDRFVLAFRGQAGVRCVDQHFGDVQWTLKEQAGLDAQIIGGEYVEAHDAYHVSYEVVRWD